MDEKRLRGQLISLYVITVAVVLFFVLAVSAVSSARVARQEKSAGFSALFYTIGEKLQTESTLQHSWLAQFEKDNALILSLSDNGMNLIYNSSDSPALTGLFDALGGLAREDGIHLNAAPLYSERRTSPVYEFRYDRTRFFGAVSLIPVKDGYRAILMAQKAGQDWPLFRVAVFAISYVLAAGILCLLGIHLIDRALRPAMESRVRQTEFIAAASHELRSPLAVIAASAATVTAIPEKAPAAAKTIENECARMSRLIGDMLQLAAADAHSWPITFSQLNMDTTLLEVYEAYAPLCAERGFRLELLLPEDPLPPIQGDGQRIAQVLIILLDNAMGCNEQAQNKALTIRAETKKDQMIIQVVDRGKGIPDQEKPHVFERFHRGDRARQDRQHFGLGLAIAYELIALHHGTITLLDTPGGGCTFSIRLLAS